MSATSRFGAPIFIAAVLAAGVATCASTVRAFDLMLLRSDPDRMQHRIETLSQYGATAEGGVSRIAYSDADIDGRKYIATEMAAIGLTIRTDAAGNLIGRREGEHPDLPPIVIGSHIDTVVNGGQYDGNVGVIGALEVAELLHAHGIRTRHPIEIVCFTDEEAGMIGSRAMSQGLDASTLDLMSDSGILVREGIRRLGGDPDNVNQARRQPGDIAAFIELHIEQGGVLHSDGVDIGVVEGIVGIRRWDIEVSGMPNHAGTTPMDRRRDALVTAAGLTLAVNRIAEDMPGRQVATVGRMEVWPSAINVIPGRVRMSLEIRDLESARIQSLFDAIASEADRLGRERDTPVRFTRLNVASEPTPTDVRLRRLIAGAAAGLGLSYKAMPSGAGHDTQEMSRLGPAGMIFVPSVNGISHSPHEFTTAVDMANGGTVLLHVVLAIDGGALTETVP